MVWKQFIKSDSYSNVIKIDKNTEMVFTLIKFILLIKSN